MGPTSDRKLKLMSQNSQLMVGHTAALGRLVPTTWPEIVAYSTSHPGSGFVARLGPGNSLVTDFVPMVWAYDDCNLAPYNDISHCPERALVPFPDREAAAQALQMFRSLVGSNASSGATMDDFDIAAYLLKRDAALGIVWSAWAMTLIGVDDGGDYSFYDMPSAGPDVGHPHPELGAWLLTIPWNAPDPSRAAKFIEFVTREKQIEMAAAGLCGGNHDSDLNTSGIHLQIFNPPPTKGVLEHFQTAETTSCSGRLTSSNFKAERTNLISHMESSLDAAWPRPRTHRWKEFEWRLSDYLDMALTENVDDLKLVDEINACLAPLFHPQDMYVKVGNECSRAEVLHRVAIQGQPAVVKSDYKETRVDRH